MFLFKSHKTLSHKQQSIVGFILAVMSLLVIAVTVYVLPRWGVWLNSNGVFNLDVFLLVLIATLFLAAQGLILFGIPIFYAKDKKSHMTGFQILIYTMMWMLLIMLIFSVITVSLGKNTTSSVSLDDLGTTDEVLGVE